MTTRKRRPATTNGYVTPERAALITVLISDRPLCLDCCAAKAGMTPASVRAYLNELAKTVVIHQGATDRCHACGTVGPTVSIIGGAAV